MSIGALPSGWVQKNSNSRLGYFYFYNIETGVSQWERPSAPPTSVRASHLLVKHRDSRNPSSWREREIRRTKEEAIAILKGFEQQLANGASFDELARQYSDCSSAKKGGDLGVFDRGKMQRPFEDAAFALKVGQMSGVVESDSGVHLILRTA